ncbi:MAG: nitrous oxide-stimulated promoter family protein [Campylobacterota bacterium]|nr:nitrous oxide-stimulated promoter family protein [Campylobacterota bacterium]
MTTQKYHSEVTTLKKFFSLYCSSRHKHFHHHTYVLSYKEVEKRYELKLCDECSELFEYAIGQLNECEYDVKPKCRSCQTRCYEPKQWKKMAKLMRYSGMKMGILKIRKMVGLKD